MACDSCQVSCSAPSLSDSLNISFSATTETVVNCDIVGQEVERLEVGEGLELVRRKVPLGVVLVVFESRPDCLPQVMANTYVVHTQLPFYSLLQRLFCACLFVYWLAVGSTGHSNWQWAAAQGRE